MAAKKSDFKIEKNVTRPSEVEGRYSFPFKEMKVGDSFAFSVDVYPNVMSASSYAGKRNGMKFSVRKQAKGEYRCWRIK